MICLFQYPMKQDKNIVYLLLSNVLFLISHEKKVIFYNFNFKDWWLIFDNVRLYLTIILIIHSASVEKRV